MTELLKFDSKLASENITLILNGKSEKSFTKTKFIKDFLQREKERGKQNELDN